MKTNIFKQIAKARSTSPRQRGKMNGLEADFYNELLLRQKAGEFTQIWFESITFDLAQNCRYTPDFVAIRANGEIEAFEVKGFWRDDARVKTKVFAELYPFHVTGVTKKNKQWLYEIF